MKYLDTIDKILAVFEKSVIVLILFSMVFLSCLQIVLRNLFASGIPSLEIVLRHLTLVLAFVGASMATREEKHLRVDIIPRIISRRWRAPISLMTHTISVIVCLILARAGWNFVVLEQQTEALFVFNIPLWVPKLIIPCGFLWIAFRMVLKMVEQSSVLISAKKGPQKTDEGDTE